VNGIFELVISFETMTKVVDKFEKITAEKMSLVVKKELTPENRTVCRTIGVRNDHGH